jgi:hypothetical protein
MRSLLLDALKALAVVLVWLGMIELSLRVTHMPVGGSYAMRDGQRSFRFRPGAHYWFETEGWNLVRVNSLGFEDRERTLRRKPGTLRLAFLGSSYVQAPQVPPEKAFPAVVERDLRRSTQLQARDVEALNFGVGAYGLPQQWITLRDDVWKYDPQIVVEVIGLYNDIVNNDRYTTVSGRTYPYYTAQDGQLIPDAITQAQQHPPDPETVKWEGRLGGFLNHSKILLYLNRAVRSTVGEREWQPGLVIDPAQTSTFFPPRDPHLENAWKVTETTLKLMRDECTAHHAEFWVVTIDFNIQSEPDPQARAARLRELGISDLHYPDRRIIEFARREGIRNFWLAPLLADYAESHRQALHGFFNTPRNFGHYNLLGHEVIGNFIAGELCRDSEALKAGVN